VFFDLVVVVIGDLLCTLLVDPVFASSVIAVVLSFSLSSLD
jgi:hypothetical protein